MRSALRALLVSLGVAALAWGAVLAQAEDERSALVVLVPGASLQDLLAIPDVGSLARAGGAALLVNPDDVVEFDGPALRGEVLSILDRADPGSLVALVDRHRPMASRDDELMVVVLGASLRPSANPGIGGIVVARGMPDELFPRDGDQGSLTSGSTRRAGVVTGGDVRATLVAFLGRGGFASGTTPIGEPIEIVDGPPPLELYERYLAHRRMSVPIGIAAGASAVTIGVSAVGALAMRRRVPSRLRRALGWAALSVPALACGLLAAGHLPTLSYPSAVPFVAAVAVAGTVAFVPLGRHDPTRAVAAIGAAVLAFFLLEAFLGWAAALTPLHGASQLDGQRFFGLPNAFIGLLIGSALYVAHRLPTPTGVAVVFGVGLFAGLPFAGANLGASVSLFAAAGLWLAIRERERLGIAKGFAAVVALVVAGTMVVVAAHAISPAATHVTRFTGGMAGAWRTFVERLEIGWELIERNPLALIPVLGVPVGIWLVLRPPSSIRESLERWPAWRDSILVTFLGGAVAYMANDTGPAAIGLAFALGIMGMLGVSLLSGAGKMGER